MAKRSILYSMIIVFLVIIFAYIMNVKNTNKVIISNYFFIVSSIILTLASISRIISWSIHKKHALNKYKSEKEIDIIDAKYKLRVISNSFFIIGFIQLLVSIVFAVI